jgi:hypothetical protein
MSVPFFLSYVYFFGALSDSEADGHQFPTVLAKILGFFQIGFKSATTGKVMRLDVLVQENLFYGRQIEKVTKGFCLTWILCFLTLVSGLQIYDLKGSMRNRFIDEATTSNGPKVLLDENLVKSLSSADLVKQFCSFDLLLSRSVVQVAFARPRTV